MIRPAETVVTHRPSQPHLTRRQALLAAAGGVATGLFAANRALGTRASTQEPLMFTCFKSLKLDMFQSDAPLVERFAALKAAGFEGVEINAPNGPDPRECYAASQETGLIVDGVIDSAHWQIRLTDPDAAMREQGLAALKEAIEACHTAGGSTVLLVPGHGNDGDVATVENRAEAGIRQALPLAAKLGVTIALENVWNSMFYDHDGAANQSADRLAAFVDRFDSPLVGVQFDIGNHQKYGPPAQWIRTLGKRIVKLDVKDWGVANGFCKIGDGDVDWPAVRQALSDIGYHGWAAAEVAGGDIERMREIAARMDRVLNLTTTTTTTDRDSGESNEQ